MDPAPQRGDGAVGSPYLGFIPDMGHIEKRFPRVRYERKIRNGANPQIVHYIAEAYERHEDLEKLAEEVKKMGGKQLELAW